MKSTGLQRSGIYYHFKSKDEIAVAAFDYTLGLILAAVMTKVSTQSTAIDRLHAFADSFQGFTTQPIAVGGCPILNTAVESDDTHPSLRRHVQGAVNDIRALISSIVELGIRQGEIVASTDHEQVSTILFVTIEGAIMMSKLYGTDVYLDYLRYATRTGDRAFAPIHRRFIDVEGHSPSNIDNRISKQLVRAHRSLETKKVFNFFRSLF